MNYAQPRRRLRRGVIILPSAFTLGNLFLGIWAIVSASRGNFVFAGWLIVLAAIADMLDGRIARMTATGTAFGEELDSLVDAISFGVAPALITYFLYLQNANWGWVLAFIYIVGAIFRLARFNIEQAGKAKSAFHGLPSPTAGVTLATYHSFTQTELWAQWFAARVHEGQLAVWMMLGLAVLMVSNVLYPVVPRFSLSTWSGRFAMAVAFTALVMGLTRPEYFFFPFAALYISWGLLRTVVEGFQDRLPERDPLAAEGDDEEFREVDYEDIRPPRRLLRLRRRKRRGEPDEELP